MGTTTKKLQKFLIIFIIFIAAVFSSKAEAVEVWTTNPWISIISNFIGGVQVSVLPLVVWDENGEIKILKNKPPEGAIVIAVDNYDFRRAMGNASVAKYELRVLFDRLSQGVFLEAFFMDPAALPFIGLRILEVLSEFDPGNYEYYQRRLAEFQARVDSTVIVGRNMIGDITILDLSWKYGKWIQAAVKKVVSPPDAVKKGWSLGAGSEVLDTAIQEARKQNWLIIADPWTPLQILERLQGSTDFLELPFPGMEQDMILFLYGLYLQIWDHKRE